MSGIQEPQNPPKHVQNAEAHIGIENDEQRKKKDMELIKIQTNQEGRKTVNARELHEFLEVGKDFSTWVKDRIEKRRFIVNEDFTTILGESTGGRPSKEYHLTIETAKMISMLENNDKGDEVRRYFIECEKKMKGELVSLSPAELILHQAQQLVDQEKRMSKMNNRIDLIEAHQTTRNEDWFTVAGYCSLKRIQVSQLQAADLGRRCAKLSRENGFGIESVPDARFGRVNIYHTDILEEIVC